MNIVQLIKSCLLTGITTAMAMALSFDVIAGQIDDPHASQSYPVTLQEGVATAPILRDTNSPSVLFFLDQKEIDRESLQALLARPLISSSFILSIDGGRDITDTADIILSEDAIDISSVTHWLNDAVGSYHIEAHFSINGSTLTMQMTDEVLALPGSFKLNLEGGWSTSITAVNAELNHEDLPVSQLMTLIKNNQRIQSRQNQIGIDEQPPQPLPNSSATIDMDGIAFNHINELLFAVRESWNACLEAEVIEGELTLCFETILVPNRYVIKIDEAYISRNPSNIKEVARQLITQYQGRLGHVYEHAYMGFSADLTPEMSQRMAQDPRVAEISRNDISHVLAVQTDLPSWGIDRIDERTLALDDRFEYHSSGDGVNIYILDSGIRATHNEFTGRVGTGANFVGTDIANTNDCHGHGTHVAGTAAGTEVGVAKDATVIPVRVLNCAGTGNTADIIAAIDWITDNAVAPAVVNVSLGFTTATISSAVDDAVESSIAAGITYVIAAGNSDEDACNYSYARVDEAITVGASKRKRNFWGTVVGDKRAGFSNFGSCVDIFAPGKSIRSAHRFYDNNRKTMSGTSMAAPHVTGIAALYLENNPSATPAAVMASIIDSATSVVTHVGSGSPNLLSVWDSPPPLPASAVRIKNESFGKCMYPYAPSGLFSMGFHNWTCWDDPGMAFVVLNTATAGEVKLFSVAGGLCITPLNSVDYDPVGGAFCSSPNSVYVIDYLTADTFRLRNKNNNKCLYGSPANGGLIRQFGCWANPDMVFSFENY